LYMHIFSHIFLSNYWWQKFCIWSQASYRYPISLEAFLEPSDSYFLFAEERGYHKWAYTHSSSCCIWFNFIIWQKISGRYVRKKSWGVLLILSHILSNWPVNNHDCVNESLKCDCNTLNFWYKLMFTLY
jgi:hypothetical protein